MKITSENFTTLIEIFNLNKHYKRHSVKIET